VVLATKIAGPGAYTSILCGKRKSNNTRNRSHMKKEHVHKEQLGYKTPKGYIEHSKNEMLIFIEGQTQRQTCLFLQLYLFLHR
jgi:hypothetical protein